MGVISILSGVGIVSFQSFGRSSLLESRTKELMSALEKAKVSARSGELGGCTILDGYVLTIDSSTAYHVSPSCISGAGSSHSYAISQSESIEISEYSSQTTSFDRLGTKTTANCYIITDVRRNVCNQVQITSGGATSLTKNDCSCS